MNGLTGGSSGRDVPIEYLIVDSECSNCVVQIIEKRYCDCYKFLCNQPVNWKQEQQA